MKPAGRSLDATLLAALVVVALLTPVASAGDNVALLYVEQDGLEAEPGDTVTVDVVLSSHGGYGGDGVGEVAFTLDYDADVLTVAEIEHGEWLTGEGVDVVTSIDHEPEAGTLAVGHRREPPGDGSTGTEPIVSLTLEIAPDAEPADAPLAFAESTVVLVNEYEQNVVDRDATIAVAGGGEPEESNGSEDEQGITLADDETDDEPGEEATDASANEATGDSPADTDPSTTAGDGESADPVAGFTALGAVVAGILLGAIAHARRPR